MLDVERGEAIEKELEAFIEKRSRKEPERDAREELWKESVRAYHASKEAERRAAWATYHAAQATRLRRTMERLAAVHETRAQQLLEEGSA